MAFSFKWGEAFLFFWEEKDIFIMSWLFEGKKMFFSFTTSQINDYYIESNEKLNEGLDRLWNH